MAAGERKLRLILGGRATRRVPAERPELTHYEERVLARILLGESNKEIAKRLGCSVKNVEYHVTQILRRTGVSSRLKLVATMSSTTR
jgi:DNA-binding CsgD family transcriptional regulator